jgi:autotransporter-associated beta strand protein
MGYVSTPTGFTAARAVAGPAFTGTGASFTFNNSFAAAQIQTTAVGSGYAVAPTVGTSTGSGLVATAVLSGVTLSGTNNSIGGAGAMTINSVIAGSGGGFMKTGTGTLTLWGANSYTGPTTIDGGRLLVNGSILGSSGLTVRSGAELGGSGVVAAITGAGLVAPGNSPGILSAPSASFSGGLDFAFEFTQPGAPTWGSAANSGNDVLRLTDPTAPLVGTATSDNVFNIYFAESGQTYVGGIFTDLDSSFESLLTNATFNYFVRDAAGSFNYGGFSYAALPFGDVTRSTVQVGSANFAGGAGTNGYAMQFVIVPEPGGIALAGLGLAAAAWVLRRRK